jgi:hypothetical protein
LLFGLLAGLTLSQNLFKTKWEGIIETLTEDNFTTAQEVATALQNGCFYWQWIY